MLGLLAEVAVRGGSGSGGGAIAANHLKSQHFLAMPKMDGGFYMTDCDLRGKYFSEKY